eukprot:5825591-Prymnesium_polylepis.1
MNRQRVPAAAARPWDGQNPPRHLPSPEEMSDEPEAPPQLEREDSSGLPPYVPPSTTAGNSLMGASPGACEAHGDVV